jgi:glycosyltransferase involved in cell wall biosynthesis
MNRLVVATRSVDDRLFELSGRLLDPNIERVKLTGTDADNYFYAFNDIDAEWIVNLDEDAFVIDWQRILWLVDYMEENDFDCCGVPDGGVIDHRFHNPISPNPYFSIHHNKRIKEKFDLAAIEQTTFTEDLKRFNPSHLFKPNHRYEFDNFEPYYSYFFWLLNTGSRFLWLDAESWARDPIATMTLDHEAQPLLLHSWYARDYQNQQWRFHLAANFCQALQDQERAEAVPVESADVPRVTIGVLTHNRRALLEQAIESARLQDVPENFEILVVDNGSTDDTAAYLESLSAEGIQSIRLPENKEKAAGRNAVIEQMKGEFVLWLDDDDVLLPNALSTHLAVLANNPDADIIYGNLYACAADLSITQEMRYQQRGPSEIARALFFFSPFPNGGTLIRKSVFERAGTYQSGLTRAEDYDLWVRAAAAQCAFVHNDTFIYKYRSHEGNSLVGETSGDFAGCNAYVLQRLIQTIPLRSIFPMYNWEAYPKQARARALQAVAARFLKFGALEQAQAALTESNSLAPSAGAAMIEALVLQRKGEANAALQRLLQILASGNAEMRELLEISGVARRGT